MPNFLIYIKRIALIFPILFYSWGCASGFSIVTGKARPSIDPATVKIYNKEPKMFEEIGIVRASSDMGLTEQGSIDYAVSEIKKQAAKIGANGILFLSAGEKTSSVTGFYSGGVFFAAPVDKMSISGKAIYVISE
jgi:hypothetical protein